MSSIDKGTEHRRRALRGTRVSLAVLAVVASVLLLKHAQQAFIPLVLSGLLFYALDPFVVALQRLRIRRAVGAAVVLLGVVGAVGWTVYAVRDQALAVVEGMPAAARNLRAALRPGRGSSDGTIDKLQRAASEIDKTTSEALAPSSAPRGVVRVQVEEPAVRMADVLWRSSVGVARAVSEGLFVLLLTYFLLLARDSFKHKLVRNFGENLSSKKLTVHLIDQISAQITRYLIVQVLTSAVVAVVTGLALWRLGVDQPAFWGIAAGVLNSIPYFGPLIVTFGLALVAFMQFGSLAMASTVAGTALLITTLEGWFLTPRLMGRAARMNQVAVFSGLIVWSWMWDGWGLLLAVPMMMVAKAVCDHVDSLKPVSDLLGE